MNRLTFRQKLFLIYTASALIVIFATFVAASMYINALQKKNVQDAIEAARDQVRNMVAEITDQVRGHGVSELDEPEIQDELQAVTQLSVKMNKSIVWAAVVLPDGTRTIEEGGLIGDPLLKSTQDGTKPDISEIDLPNGEKLTVEVVSGPKGMTDVSAPIPSDTGTLGRIQLRMTPSKEFLRIEEQSRQITNALTIGCLMMLILLLVIFAVLSRMFSRHLALQQHAEKLDRMAYVGTLASGLAHEIRNPLSSMNVNLEVITEDLQDQGESEDSRTVQLVRRVQKEVLQLNGTLTAFLQFALPNREGYSQFSLRGLVEDILELHAEKMRQAGITWELEAPPSALTTVEADRHLLHQAVQNVVVNAAQILTTSVKKQLRVVIEERPHDFMRIGVIDSGPGIAADAMPHIFDVFFSTRKGGSGFGLAIARKIIEEHGGQVWAENNQETLGATFYLTIPKFAAAPAARDEDQRLFSRLRKGA